ncbi:MAG: AAA family ATPase [Planctomycetota bacterium]
MRLKRLKLKNFRCFYGESEIEFAGGDKNITVIHGENGAGKTVLLNAFKWVLYEQLTSGVQLEKQIVTKRAIYEADSGDVLEAYVELEFEHDERRYLIKRRVEAKVGSTPQSAKISEPEVILQVCGADGEWRIQERPADVIGRVLPPDLHSYFFFDGERIEQIVKLAPAEQEQIATASKKLLGVEILDRADKHLAKARKELEKQLRDVGDSQTRLLIDEKTALDEKIDRQERDASEIKTNLDKLDEQNTEIEDRLRQLEDVKALQERRDQLNEDLGRRKDALKEHSSTIKKMVSGSAHNVFLAGPIQRFEGLCDELRERGELPAGIKKQFVADLLESGKCICGANLTAGSAHTQAVEGWLEKAGLVDVEEKAIRIGGSITQLSHELPRFLNLLDSRQKMRQSDREEVARIEVELDDISDQLKSSPREEVASLEKRKNDLKEQRESLTMDRGVLINSIMKARTRKDEIDDEIDKLEANEERQRLAKARVDAAGDARKRIVEIKELMEEDFRADLEQRVSRLFQQISPTPYVVRIPENYSLQLFDGDGENALPTDGSTGERQILSLAFIGSIIELTREYQKRGDSLPGPDSSHFPIVMDSPFGALSIYRTAAAEHMPILADQVVVMVSPKQWDGDVERSMRNKTGREYVLRYSTPKKGIKPLSIDIKGETFELIDNSSNEYEFTEILEVSNG